MTTNDTDILILDDDIDLLTSVAEVLADYGYRVKGFADPESALEYAFDHTFTLGLFDFRLGSVKNGLDVMEMLRTMGVKSTFVMVSADTEHSIQIRAKELKVSGFLSKPVKPQELIDIIGRALANDMLAA